MWPRHSPSSCSRIRKTLKGPEIHFFNRVGCAVKLGDVYYDPQTNTLADSAGSALPMRQQSFDVLAVLVARQGEVVSRDEIFAAVWPDVTVTDDSLTQCIADIRKVIGDSDRTTLRTLPRKGYQLVAQPQVRRSGRKFWTLGIALAGLVAASLSLAVIFTNRTSSQIDTHRQLVEQRTPSIAVMPFTDISGDPRWQRLGEGLAVEISNELARNHWLDVRAPSSAQQVAGLKGLAAAEKLEVAMLLDGTLQSDGTDLRISARLTSAETRAVIWSNKWSGPLEDLFKIQDLILDHISGSLAGHWSGAIANQGRRGVAKKPTYSVTAFEHYVLASQAKHLFTPDGYAKCIEHNEAAIRIDAEYAQAWALKSICELWYAPFAESTEEKAAYMERVALSAKTAFRIDPEDPVALWNFAARGRDTIANRRSILRRAVMASPSNADDLAASAWISGYVAFFGPEPLQWAERAFSLNPNPPAWYHIARGVAAYHAGKDTLAIDAFQRAPKMTESLLFHAAAEWRQGNSETAQALIAEHLDMAPEKTLVDHFGQDALTLPDFKDLRAMALKLGLPLE